MWQASKNDAPNITHGTLWLLAGLVLLLFYEAHFHARPLISVTWWVCCRDNAWRNPGREYVLIFIKTNLAWLEVFAFCFHYYIFKGVVGIIWVSWLVILIEILFIAFETSLWNLFVDSSVLIYTNTVFFLSHPSLGWVYVFSSFPPPRPHPPPPPPPPPQWLLLLTSKPFELELRYLGQRNYRSGKMYGVTFGWPWPKVTAVTLINKICLSVG